LPLTYPIAEGQIFQIAGNLAGKFFGSSQKSQFSARIPQFWWLEQGISREFAGNLQLST
jgi:hypothetical protein